MRPLNLVKFGTWIFLIFGFTAIVILGSSRYPVAAQQLDTVTPSPTVTVTVAAGMPYITVTYIEPINVRTGPSSFDYPIVGTLPVGGTAAAIGRSPAGEWVEIEFPQAPRGTAWVYAANVTVSPPNTLLPVVEPPPTPAPLETDTLNPTFVAAFPVVPTSTRLPTFTPPPPLAIPTFENQIPVSSGKPITAWLMAGLGLIGVLGIAFTSFRHH
ncbi:MAG: SH3 domain-containing protein [Anaerolineales bacterium]